jgi:hypothetical protein
MKLAESARRNGVHPQTAYRWFRDGTMPVPARRLPSGTKPVSPLGWSDQAERVGGDAKQCADAEGRQYGLGSTDVLID